jgi:hypothetical protein
VLNVFGEAVFLAIEGGKQGGDIRFEGARTDDGVRMWNSRLEQGHANSNDHDGRKIEAKVGFRAGVGCSSSTCWEARGLKGHAELLAAILAAGALAAARCSLDDQDVLDLSALASNLEADTSKQAKLVKGALAWLERNTKKKPKVRAAAIQATAVELLDFGIAVESRTASFAGGPFEGKTVAFTGTLTDTTRAEAKQLVEDRGGRVSSSVGAKTDFLVQGGKPGSKAKKAEENGVRVLLEKEFQSLLADGCN